MNEERFDWLEDVLEKVILKRKPFRMDRWRLVYIGKFWREMTDEEIIKQISICDSAACAIGHCMVDQRFIDAGLKTWIPRSGGQYCHVMPIFKGYEGFDAISRFFSISMKDAIYLFSCKSYSDRSLITARDVLYRVRQFRAKNNPEERPEWINSLEI